MQLDPVTIQVLWQRLVSIVDEAATGLIRTAYTPSVKEYYDFCCAVFDRNGNMLAHSTVTTAGFLGIVPEVMRNFVKFHPPETLEPGDAIITNDPWLASGHLIDISIASPIFHRGQIVGYTLCIVHHLDMGGRMSTLESKNIYEEGLKIPVLKLYERGKLNKAIFEFMKANIRVPDKVLGDVRAQFVANHVCMRQLINLLEEYQLEGLEDLAHEIIERSDASLRAKIRKLPEGTYHNEVTLPPIPQCPDRVRIKVAVTIKNGGVLIDYAGTSGEVGAAINCVLNMTRSYSAYPIKLALDPTVPNNDGAMRPITVVAPVGSVVNCQPPAATWGRTMISHLFPEIIFGALEDVMPELVLGANGGCPANEIYLHGRRRRDGRSFLAIQQHSGGFGASHRFDGYSTLCFPNNTRNIPIEVTENEAPVRFLRKALVSDSGGPGFNRGGLGQVVEFSILDGEQGPEDFAEGSVRLSNRGETGDFPLQGRCGGGNGRGGGLWLNDKPIDHGIYRRFKPNDRITFQLGGGGGFGVAFKRDAGRVRDDVIAGLVSIEGAARDYGVVIDPRTYEVNHAATEALRARGCPAERRIA
ncbi:MAG: N-methylhydantoinase B [Pseudolabrys sp.]|jgi:N-methylhydantoinase B|nr:N-methylhydantoinase B [Pseudolabrys sp.]